ncbi:flagellar protein FlaG [Pseudomonas sp. R5(2019)]|uniref:flagellar protein FlaG n=1 Tax=Pseudomonas sp. R5(2019) TaxID=2697566 RepID=UPI0014125257|nr:flagellar protein FlaG [Pseudomonas sp. R5(2019)]NBA95758.1 flagellar biosynthesis protein FlaG [Pseudomonas sp. R5(2019)]
MDMSVKLNLSYPAPVAQDGPSVKPGVALIQAAVEETEKPERLELEKAVKDIQDYAQATRRQLDFSIDDSTGQVVVKVIATQSGEVVRQIPSETALKLAQSLNNGGSLLFDEQA